MIEFDGAGRRYGGRRGVEAVADVSLGVERGRVTAVVGPNGAGKSTLFALALGFLGPTSGRVTIEGQDPRSWVRARGVGYVPERFVVPGEWRVGRLLAALGRLEEGGAVDVALERWGLGPVAERAVGGLSRGMVQRVALAQAMLVRHTLVVLDEPSEGLDPVWRNRLRDVIDGLRREGTTVLLASHDLAEVERVADRVVVLDGGRVAETFDARAAEPGQWRLRLDSGFDVAAVFPDATAVDTVEYVVRAEGVADLNARLAALLAAGARVSSLVPETATVETRVRRVLEPPDA